MSALEQSLHADFQDWANERSKTSRILRKLYFGVAIQCLLQTWLQYLLLLIRRAVSPRPSVYCMTFREFFWSSSWIFQLLPNIPVEQIVPVMNAVMHFGMSLTELGYYATICWLGAPFPLVESVLCATDDQDLM